jgi:hypothetical protein
VVVLTFEFQNWEKSNHIQHVQDQMPSLLFVSKNIEILNFPNSKTLELLNPLITQISISNQPDDQNILLNHQSRHWLNSRSPLTNRPSNRMMVGFKVGVDSV